jgi:hypothetical protein
MNKQTNKIEIPIKQKIYDRNPQTDYTAYSRNIQIKHTTYDEVTKIR